VQTCLGLKFETFEGRLKQMRPGSERQKAKEKQVAPKADDDAPKSEAMKNFEANLEQIKAFVSRFDSAKLHHKVKVSAAKISKELAGTVVINDKTIQREVDVLTATINRYLAFTFPASRWISVMLISFLEGYLEDGLVELARKNPGIVKAVVVNTSRIFEVDELEDLRNEVRRQWAQDALRPNGPEAWRKTLRQLGAPTLGNEIIYAIQHLWDTRNLIVHSRCIASAGYAKKYAHLGAKKGEEVKVNIATFGNWLKPTKAFVEWAEAFFLKYGGGQEGKPGLAMAATPDAV
jgi:hypothetical protein